MNRVLCILLAFSIVLSLGACGNSQSPEASVNETSNNKSDTDKVVPLNKPIVILDNEYAKIEVIELFQEYVEWAKRPHCVEKGFTVKITNKHDEKIHIHFRDLYIGDTMVTLCQNNGSIMPPAGKTVATSFYIWQQTGHNEPPLNDMNEAYQLEGSIKIDEYYKENAVREISKTQFSFSQ